MSGRERNEWSKKKKKIEEVPIGWIEGKKNKMDEEK